MASSELVIDENYCQAIGSFYKQQEEAMDNLLSAYLSVLNDVKNGGIISGDASDQLSSFLFRIERVRKIWTQSGMMLSECTQKMIAQFLSKVDAEDDFIF